MNVGNRRFTQSFHKTLFDFIKDCCNALLKARLHTAAQRLGGVLAARYKSLIQREVDISKGDAFSGFGQPPTASMSLFRRQQARFAKPPKHSAHHDRVCSSMIRDISRSPHAVWVARHVTERM